MRFVCVKKLFFFLGLVSKFSKIIKEKEAIKNHIQHSKSYEQQNDFKKVLKESPCS